jgi:PAS domain S-box-containing protein
MRHRQPRKTPTTVSGLSKDMDPAFLGSRRRRLFDTAEEGLLILEADTGRIKDVNPFMIKMSGFPSEEFAGKRLWESGPFEDREAVQEAFSQLQNSGYVRLQDLSLKTKDGRKVAVEFIGHVYPADGSTMAQCHIRDITGRKNAEEALLESEKVYHGLAEKSLAAVGILQDGVYRYFNGAYEDLSGYSAEEIRRWEPYEFSKTIHPDDRDFVMNQFRMKQTGAGEDVPYCSFRGIRKNGEIRWIELHSRKVDYHHRPADQVTLLDITPRKRTEAALRESEEKYRGLAAHLNTGVYRSLSGRGGRLAEANAAIVDMFGYSSREEFLQTPVAHLFHDAQRRAEFNRRILENGVVRNMELGLKKQDGSSFIGLVSAAVVRDDEGKVRYYDGIVEDITARKQAEEERIESFKRLRKSLGATIQAMAVTVERRDPYTAGHQRRVADLARTIATEMKLSGDQIDGIRMAAIIHDLGKISVPAEILSKPTKSIPMEFNLIKIHSQSGYDILKDIDFPWPIARIVLEHHERMDGSGYPNGLTGEHLLIESRIIAVADTVEAIASNRPYRPSLGIEKALEEIDQNKGILFDPDVVRACLKIFREKGYKFPG